MKKLIVISLGGSLIAPEKSNFKVLDDFKKTLEKNFDSFKFVVVCGGGTVARKYIEALKLEGKNNRELADAGIRATRMNAFFMMQFFGKNANETLPMNLKEVEHKLPKNKVVFCGALRYEPNSTSDGTAAKIAHYFKTEFVNLTNVDGLFSENPEKNLRAKFIPKISWKDFEEITLKLKFKPGQNFVLDQNAAKLIRKNKIKTYILGDDFANLDKLLKGKKFVGTIIEG